jgi:hypothetical protein
MPGILDDTPVGVLDPRSMALMQMGLGLMQSSGPSLTPTSLGQSLGQAGQQGMKAFQQAQAMQKQDLLMKLQTQKLQKDMEAQAALRGLVTMTRNPTPLPQQALAEGAATGDLGPTVTNAARLDALESNPVRAAGFQPVPLQALAGAAASGVDINPFIKLNELATPNTEQIDAGNEILIRDKRTQRIIQRIPKQSAPGARPFEAGDITPSEYRGFLTGKSAAGAARTITNVNAFTPASEAAQKEFIDASKKNWEALSAAPVMLQNIGKAKDLASSGNPFIGSFGTQKASVAQFFNNNFGTSIAPDAIADAGELKNRLFQQIMDNLKKMDAAPSQMQQQLMMEALGNLNTDPKALQQIMGVTEEVIRGKVDVHNKSVQDAEKRGVKFPFNPVIDLPKAAKEAMTSMPSAAQNKGRVIEDDKGTRYKSDGMSWRKM